MKPTQLIDLFQRARAGQTVAVIEGAQAVKHAARFGAKFQQIITYDISYVKKLLHEIAPDISQKVLPQIEAVTESVFQRLSPQPPRTKLIALAQRAPYQLADITSKKPIIFLEDPRDLENIGAVIRVSAAADAAAVVISGPADIWHPAVIRGAAGLQYAIPVLSSSLKAIAPNREVVALDPTGKSITVGDVPSHAVLVFGTERHGITPATLKKADKIIRLPMKEGVSSLNLATSVAATLYMM